ncbi:MAG: hypothetical protein AB1726_13560 [Planctomycetota bacterium]
MAETPLIQPAGPGPISRSADTARAKTRETAADGPAFRVLLERLQARAQELERASIEVRGPELLPGAVDTARASLEDALSLSDRILEAYREAQRRAASPAAPARGAEEEQR